VIVAWGVGSTCVGLLPAWGLGSVEDLRRTVLVWITLFGLTTMVLFFWKAGADASRLTVTMGFLFSAPLLLASRVFVKKTLVGRQAWGIPAVIYGAGRTGALMLQALAALLVWLVDFDKPFFVQERIGRFGRRFRVWKLRTMVTDAEEVLANRLASDSELAREWSEGFKLKKDPRVTWIGATLRRTSLDELPQLFNVLCGEMSLVGPRPLPPYHNEELTERVRRLRDQVRPGMTGLWQVSGRTDLGKAGIMRWDPYLRAQLVDLARHRYSRPNHSSRRFSKRCVLSPVHCRRVLGRLASDSLCPIRCIS
jgi:lipopolysaccharide/colanic/teichoic acid biosynthesis glycosyltransferase